MHRRNSNSMATIAWLMCGLGAVFYSYEYFLRISPSVMESALRQHFNLSATGFGFLSSFYYYAYVPMQIPVGIMMDRYGPRLLLTLACVACVVGTFIFGITHYFWVAAVGRFLVGFGSAFAFVGVLKLATIWLPENKLAMVSGLAAALGAVGAMIGDNILGELVINIGWQETVQLSGIAGIVLTFILWFGIRDKKKMDQEEVMVDTFRQSMRDLLIIAKNSQIWINGLYGCLVYLPTTVLAELWGIPYLTHAQNMSQKSAGFANSLIFLGFIIGAPLMGFISDKLRRRKLPMMVGALGAALIMIIILYVPGLNESNLRVLLFLLGIFYSVQAIVFAVGRELSPKEAAGTAMAMTNMIVMLGASFLQPVIGNILDWSVKSRNVGVTVDSLSSDQLIKFYTTVDYQLALMVIPLGILIAAVLTFFLKETYAEA